MMPRPGHPDPQAQQGSHPLVLPGHPIRTPHAPHPQQDPLTCEKSRHPPPHGPAARGPGGPRWCSGDTGMSRPTPDRNRVWGEGLGSWDGDEGGSDQGRGPQVTAGS